jgi:hypothetical protein
MSGGGRRGEIRKRKGGPCPKVAGGAHNRKARRVTAAKDRKASPEPLDVAAVAARIAERRRRERDARKSYWKAVTHEELLEMRLEQSERESDGIGGQWFLPLLFEAVPGWIQRHAATPPAEREARAHVLGEIIAYSQGAAAICDPDARGTEQLGQVAQVFDAIAEGLAIGAFSPGGALFAGRLWEVNQGRLRVFTRSACGQVKLDGL